MALRIKVADEIYADVREPERGEYPENLGGAFEFTVTHFLYKGLEIAGEAIGVFLAGSVVKFLETVEPHMIEYVEPLISGMLDMEGLPPWFRDYLEKVRDPEHEVGAALLQTLSGSVVGGATSSLMGVLFAPVTQALNKKARTTIPDVTTLLNLARRGRITWDNAKDAMARMGYDDGIIDNLNDITRPRLDLGSLIEGIRRDKLSPLHLTEELEARGFPSQDRQVALAMVDQLADLGSIMTGYYRESLSEGDAKSRMAKLGYNATDQALILSNSQVIPGVADLVQMAVREAWDDDVASAWGYDADFSQEFGDWAQKQGLSREWAQRYWRAHWALPSVTLAFQMYHREIIGREELEALLRTADYPAGWRERMIEAAYQPITRVDVRRFYRLGLFDRDDLVSRYSHLGYSPDDAENMADFTVAYEGSGGEDESAEARNITRTLIEKAYRAGQLTREESAVEMAALRYTTEHIELMLSLVDTQRDLDAVPDFLTDYRKDMQSVLIKSYTKRMISGQDVSQYLIELGFDAQEADLQMQVADFAYVDAMRDTAIDLIGENYVRRTISQGRAYELIGGLNVASTQQDQLFTEWDMQRTWRTRKLTEAQYRKAFKSDMIDLDAYGEHMRGLGYSEGDVEILLQMAQE